jgi:two-component system sensor histidine kinase QseC
LVLARLEEAPVAQPSSFELGDVVRGVAAELAPVALAHQQSLTLDVDVPCEVTGHALLLGVLVRNLIDNALRYSPDGARVQVEVLREGGHALVRVQDNGPGMSESDIARLGERFYRLPGHERPGSGLGWSIVKRIAEVLGVQVTVNRSRLLGGLAVTVQWQVVAEEE